VLATDGRSTTGPPLRRQLVHGLRAERQRAAVGHRIPCVDGDVEQSRLQLCAIGQTKRRVVVHAHLDADALVQRAAQQFDHGLHEPTDVDTRRLQDLSAREGQQFFSQLGRSPGCSRGRADHLLQCRMIGDRRRVLYDLQVTGNHRQQVVEVVSDAACQLADALQPLRMVQSLVAARALQACREQACERLEEADFFVAEAHVRPRSHRKHSDGLFAVGQRRSHGSGQSRIRERRRDVEARGMRAVSHDHILAAGHHVSRKAVGVVGHAHPQPFETDQSSATCHYEMKFVGLEQVHGRVRRMQRLRRDAWRLVDEALRVPAVDGQAPELGHLVAVARTSKCLRDAGIGLDAPDRGHDVRQALSLQRAQSDFHHDLGAVAALGD
jgi:hypothetical protein